MKFILKYKLRFLKYKQIKNFQKYYFKANIFLNFQKLLNFYIKEKTIIRYIIIINN